MKKLLLLSFIIGVVGCGNDKIIKPFTIVNKEPDAGNFWYYGYQDSVGNRFWFHDTKNYNIGDTIK